MSADNSKDAFGSEVLRQSPKFKVWKRNIESSGCVIRKLESLQELCKPDGSLLFALLKSRVEDPKGRPLPAYALLRGGASLVVPVVENAVTGERKFLMIRQRRIGHGHASLEFPAGMLDKDVGDPAGVALRELREETGLDIAPEDLHSLCDKGLYSSPGLDDETIHFFTCHIVLSPESIANLDGSEKGEADEHEYIQTSLWTIAEALPEMDSLQARLALYLYGEYKQRRSNGNGRPS